MSTGDHEYRAVPMWTAGSCGGYFRSGRSLKTNGGPHNPLLCSIANAMGVPTPAFGAAAYDSGEMPGLRG